MSMELNGFMQMMLLFCLLVSWILILLFSVLSIQSSMMLFRCASRIAARKTLVYWIIGLMNLTMLSLIASCVFITSAFFRLVMQH